MKEVPTNTGGEDFEQSKLTGKYRRVRKARAKLIPPEEQERLKNLMKIAQQTSDLEKVQASRLADMDYCYLMDEEATAGMMKISKAYAAKLRKMAAYKRRLWELKEQHNTNVEKLIDKSYERMKMRFQQLVPKAIEALADHLEGDDPLMRLQASREVLDRDGRMPKVSRVQTQPQAPSKIPTINDATMEEFGLKPKAVN